MNMKPLIEGFQPFSKIARLNRDCVITEKLDGTNAQVHVVPAAEYLVILHILTVLNS